MSPTIKKIQDAFAYAMEIRPKVGGFPVLAEVLRQAGVKRNLWSLPSCQSIYLTNEGPLVNQGQTLLTGMSDISAFNEAALVKALRTDQNGLSTFPEFLMAAWLAGVVSYDVDFEKRVVIYYGAFGESYTEAYSAVDLSAFKRQV